MIFFTFSETLANVLTPQRAGKDTRLPSRPNETRATLCLRRSGRHGKIDPSVS